MADEALSFASFQLNEDPLAIVNALTKHVPQNELFLELSVDLFRTSRIQLKSLLQAMDIKLTENSQSMDQFLHGTETKLASLANGAVQKAANSVAAIDAQIATEVQKGKRIVQSFAQKRREIKSIAQNQHFLHIMSLFLKHDEAALNKLLNDPEQEAQILLAMSLAKTVYLQRHDDLLLADWNELISQYLNEFENNHLLLFRQAASVEEARKHCEVLNEFNEAFSCIKVFINNLPMFLPKENEMFVFFDSRLSFEFDDDMEAEIVQDISQYFAALLNDFSAVWTETILKVFPSPILCVEKFIERLYIELLQNYIEKTLENSSKHSSIAYVKVFSIIYQEVYHFSMQIFQQIYQLKSTSFQDSFVVRYMDEIFLPYFAKIIRAERAILLDFYQFLQRKSANLDPSIIYRISKISVAGLKGLEDCKYCTPFEDVLIGLNLFYQSLERVSGFKLENFDDVKIQFFQLMRDELFFKHYFEKQQSDELNNLFIILKLLSRIESEYFDAGKFQELFENLYSLTKNTLKTEIANWIKDSFGSVWKGNQIEADLNREITIVCRKTLSLISFDEGLVAYFIKQLQRQIVGEITELILQQTFDKKMGKDLEQKLSAIAKVLNSISLTPSIDSFDFLTTLSELFLVSSSEINELLLKEPFTFLSKEKINALLSRRQDASKEKPALKK